MPRNHDEEPAWPDENVPTLAELISNIDLGMENAGLDSDPFDSPDDERN